VTVNGNRYRGNNYVLDGAMNTNPNNSGEPAIVPSLESVEEVQVQTLNFSSEFGRGNGAVINIQTRSGTNQLRGRAWEYHRHAALNAANYFATDRPPQVFNQFGANVGGPLRHNRTFFFGSYEGTRNDIGRSYAFQVETPELRDYVLQQSPSSVAARLLREFPAPAPLAGVNGSRYLDQRDRDDARRIDSRDRARRRHHRGSHPLRSVHAAAVAVKFARALTTRPGALTDAEYDALKQEFGEVGAQELLIQTCNFAFMNRFTDGLMLPSEDEAIRVYQEIYGPMSTR
jgi:hypothetical protein